MQPSDIEIARNTAARPILEIGEDLGLPTESLRTYGRYIAKIPLAIIAGLEERCAGRLILVTGISPTPAGEGKTTTAVGLTDGLNRIGKHAAVCLREPSLGPTFGMKGGAAGGGFAQVFPMEELNLHFTGDFHAIGAAHNLLAALIDNHIYWRNELEFDSRRVLWRRVLDMNDRSLREIAAGLGGIRNGFPRETGFDITAASEVMAILCLADNLRDLERRLGRILIGYTRGREPLQARDLEAHGPMGVLLKDAFMPNLVQTLEGNPAFIHGGPFANIAHGCNTVIATRTALRLVDYVVTEAGFGADLGAEKFFDIKCRVAKLKPDAAVIVATTRALKYHGGAAKSELEKQDLDSLARGLPNLRRHIRNVTQFGVPVMVAINHFAGDYEVEIEAIQAYCRQFDVDAIESVHWSRGGGGAEHLAAAVAKLADSGSSCFVPLYDDELSLWEKARTIARRLYGADDIIADKKIRDRFRRLDAEEFGRFPVCMAKTQYSFSTDPNLRGAPRDHVVPIRDIRPAAGAGFVIALCGEIMTMPGLPRTPSARQIGLDENGNIKGLF